jgi:hypothetical protein
MLNLTDTTSGRTISGADLVDAEKLHGRAKGIADRAAEKAAGEVVWRAAGRQVRLHVPGVRTSII